MCCVALVNADRYEATPTMRHMMSRFTETLNLESASTWNKFWLALMGVEFERMEHTSLDSSIANPKFYDHTTEATDNFKERMYPPSHFSSPSLDVVNGRLRCAYRGVREYFGRGRISGLLEFRCGWKTR